MAGQVHNVVTNTWAITRWGLDRFPLRMEGNFSGDAPDSAPPSGGFEIGGKPDDQSNGRVFLIDATGEIRVSIEQHDINVEGLDISQEHWQNAVRKDVGARIRFHVDGALASYDITGI